MALQIALRQGFKKRLALYLLAGARFLIEASGTTGGIAKSLTKSTPPTGAVFYNFHSLDPNETVC